MNVPLIVTFQQSNCRCHAKKCVWKKTVHALKNHNSNSTGHNTYSYSHFQAPITHELSEHSQRRELLWYHVPADSSHHSISGWLLGLFDSLLSTSLHLSAATQLSPLL